MDLRLVQNQVRPVIASSARRGRARIGGHRGAKATWRRNGRVEIDANSSKTPAEGRRQCAPRAHHRRSSSPRATSPQSRDRKGPRFRAGAVTGRRGGGRQPAIKGNSCRPEHAECQMFSMTHWMTGVCETNGTYIHYLRTGGSKPPLLLLHGLTGSGACWIPWEFEHAAPWVSLRGLRKRCRWTHPRARTCRADSAGPLDGGYDGGRGRESTRHGHSWRHLGRSHVFEPSTTTRGVRE